MPLSALARPRTPGPRRARLTPLDHLGRLGLHAVTFSKGLLQHDLWGVQERILASVEANERTAVKACHGSGKTFTAADAVLWWPSRFDDGMVVTTAPTWTQVEKLLWGHVHKAAKSGIIQFPKLFATELKLGPDNYAIGLSTNEGVRFQGWHGRILVVLDEAPGVIPDIWEAIEGMRAGGYVHVLALGQPMLLGGPFHDAFHSQRAGWETITISAFDTPNLAGLCLDDGNGRRFGSRNLHAPNLLRMSDRDLKDNPRPYLISRSWVREKWEEWGASGSPLWDVKVLGDFPAQSEDALLALAWLERAKDVKPGHEHEPLRAGVDVAGPGEAETVVSIRQGPNRIAIAAFTHSDARGPVVDFLRPYQDRLEQVNYDSIGQGHYFGLSLKDAGFTVRAVNIQETFGVNTVRFKDQKAAYYWNLRERAIAGDIGGLDDALEQAQLLSIRYEHTAKGQVHIVSKEKMVADGIRSPDRAEADMLAFAPDVPQAPKRHGLGSRTYSG